LDVSVLYRRLLRGVIMGSRRVLRREAVGR
jgi:hypothetical protein